MNLQLIETGMLLYLTAVEYYKVDSIASYAAGCLTAYDHYKGIKSITSRNMTRVIGTTLVFYSIYDIEYIYD